MIRRAQQIATGAGSKLPLLVGLDSVHGANYVQVQIVLRFAAVKGGVVCLFGHRLIIFETFWSLVLLQLQHASQQTYLTP